MRTLIALLAGLLLVMLPPGAQAQVHAPAPADSGMFLIFDHATPIAHERHIYQNMGDSLLISAATERSFVDEKGQRVVFRKTMLLVVDARDLGLMHYVSNQDFNGHKVVRGLLPTDTVMTFYNEYDDVGSADRVVQPPGRLFVLDPQLFTLFDVLSRSLAGKEFETRRVQLVALGADSLTTPMAIVTMGKPDTLRLGGRRVPTRHYTIDDHGVQFELWADARGRMLSLKHEPSGLAVERVPDAPAVRAPRRRLPGRR